MRRFRQFRSTTIFAAAVALFCVAAIPARGQSQPTPPPPNATIASGAATDHAVSQPPSHRCPSSDYRPDGTVTNSEHLYRFGCAVFSWQTIAGPAVRTSFSQWTTSHKGYGSDPNAWGYHFGINLAGNVSGKFLARYAGPAIFHQDDAYQPLGPGHSTGARIRHILSHLVVTDSADHTHRVFNVSAIPASAVNTGLQNLYQPHALRTVGNNVAGFAEDLAVFAGSDAYTEYRCAILKLVPFRHPDSACAPSKP
jgi:hypothetical protein